ncbi:GspE/PulE family protein [Eleftheria terrae]|uniref:GspE/PulE family protein n=1 Tax=Eleftheria terrae TaxID=1597781 RepID=UPI00263AE625|nr:GspE/PulE family protein [Eleftheria terrae]WKB56140.1 GspE/PulE family protein [Eleftheria terrae]
MTTPLVAGAIAEARAAAQASGRSVLEEVRQRLPSALPTLGHALGMEEDHDPTLNRWQPDFARIPYSAALQRGIAAARNAEGACLLVSDPFELDQLNWAQARGPILPERLVPAEALRHWLARYESAAVALSVDALGAAATDDPRHLGDSIEDLSAERLEATGSPIVRLVNATLYDALRAGASDIHLETSPAGLAVKFRLDGVLRHIRDAADPQTAEQAISRIKVMAELDIAERRVPQDGRLQVQVQGRTIDVRVSIMPSIHGEDAVLRILDRQHLARSLKDLTLTGLGLMPELAAKVLRLARRPHGMVLVTGPTGSGKTTTLYAAINETCTAEEKVVTIEDPVEYQLPGVLQIPVNERKGLSFARGLRSILRHDPDKILVGEIRDAETAQIAVQAALTGHLVFTTVHANDALDVLGRFQQFGIDRYALASALNGVLAQRLMRRLCVQCSPARPAHGTAAASSTPGCPACLGTGYRGRFAIGDLLTMTPELKGLIVDGAPYQEIQRCAQSQGARSLREQAMEAVARGWTTTEEVERVTGSD